MIAIFIYLIIGISIFTLGYWYICKCFNRNPYKEQMNFTDYKDTYIGYIILLTLLWPLTIIMFPIILALCICYVITERIKKYYNINDR